MRKIAGSKLLCCVYQQSSNESANRTKVTMSSENAKAPLGEAGHTLTVSMKSYFLLTAFFRSTPGVNLATRRDAILIKEPV